MASITVHGLAEVQRALREAPRTLVLRSFARALSAGAGVIEAELAVRTPIGDETTNNELLGHLVDNITSEVKVDTQGRGGTARVGFGKKGYVARWLEYGHRQVSHQPGKRQVGRTAAHPFMRPAVTASAEGAIEAFQNVLSEDLKKNL
jgi:HK97 gp10 family phage protein